MGPKLLFLATVGDFTVQLSLSTVFVTCSTLICPCIFTLARHVARLLMDYIKFSKLGNSSDSGLPILLWRHMVCCNSLLFGIPKYQTDRLKKVLNAAARFVFWIDKLDHISSSMFCLHWLPGPYCVHFKLLLLVYRVLNNQGPQYIKDFLHTHYITTHRLGSCDFIFLEQTATWNKIQFKCCCCN